jgi:uncharacterized protein (TIGR00255 family)
MTAYGRGEYSFGSQSFIAEIRSLNHRYRDVIIRVPKVFQTLEDEIRSKISSRIKRGRIEVSIQMEKNSGEAEYDLELNLPLVRSYLRIFEKLKDEFGLDEKIRPDYLAQMKDVIQVRPEEIDVDKSRAGLQELISQALDSLDIMRVQEGKSIEEDFLKRLDRVGIYLQEIEERSPQLVEEYRDRLKDKINNISKDIDIDENRLVQEVAIFASRCDINEEIVRTRSHLKQFHKYMTMDGSIGRRLDFLIQEINREVNTIASKALNSSISSRVVEMKAELERLREQVQNVE